MPHQTPGIKQPSLRHARHRRRRIRRRHVVHAGRAQRAPIRDRAISAATASASFAYSNFDIIAPRAMFSLCRYNYRII